MNTLIVDDHAVVRAGLKNIVSEIPGIRSAFEAGNAAEALEVLGSNECNIVILDISLPDRNGLELLKDIKKKYSGIHVLMLSVHDNPQYALRAIKAGADGYITKSEAFDELKKAIKTVRDGRKYVSADIALDLTFASMETEKEPHESLSDREFEVFILLAEGKTLKDIADILCIHSKTVSTYKTRILEKMNFKSNSDITKYALQNKLIE